VKRKLNLAQTYKKKEVAAFAGKQLGGVKKHSCNNPYISFESLVALLASNCFIFLKRKKSSPVFRCSPLLVS
jgi:hypothetical protein